MNVGYAYSIISSRFKPIENNTKIKMLVKISDVLLSYSDEAKPNVPYKSHLWDLASFVFAEEINICTVCFSNICLCLSASKVDL